VVIAESKNLSDAYFIGYYWKLLVLCTDSNWFWIFGLKTHYLLVFLAYYEYYTLPGPIIGSALGMTLDITATVASGAYMNGTRVV